MAKEERVEKTEARHEVDLNSKKAKYILLGIFAFVLLSYLLLGGLLLRGLFGRGRGVMDGKGMMGRGFRQERGFGDKMMGGGFRQNSVSGTVKAVEDKKFTIDVNGTTKTVQISDTTRFSLNSATSVKVNDKVLVWGEQDSNGVIQANRVEVNPRQ
jgi:hypothetical protein